eukprot:TRINITY_DN116_c0_g1_i2.p1 TRINITY_DN116_c0_g1~~TRINITY_DN116_c0_g1_i2.p1  ORF type:complete len:422 (-),score=46.10 TRINITY_DN116_c0_g1_i2:110-1375(-)
MGNKAADAVCARKMVATRKKARVLALAASCDAKAEASQQRPDMWMKIFEFLAHGHYLQLSSVSTGWRSLYATSMQLKGLAAREKQTYALAMVASAPLIQWAFTNGCKVTARTLFHAVTSGTLKAMQFVYANMPHRHRDIIQDWPVCNAAAGRGDLEMLQWARSKGCYLHHFTGAAAARGGHLEVLQWVHADGCPLDVNTCAAAASGGHLQVLRWARDIGCEWDEETCDGAAEGGHMLILQYARSHGCPWSTETSSNAARHGHLQLLQWAHANGCPLDAGVYSAAAEGGHFHVLQWLHEVGCPCDELACKCAAAEGHLDILQFLRAQGCPWNGRVCTAAIEKGNLELLQWARANGCPWQETGTLNYLLVCVDHTDPTSLVNVLAAVEWALANGCPCSDTSRAQYMQLRCRADDAQAHGSDQQ